MRTSIFADLSNSSETVSPGSIQVTFILLAAISCLIASDTLSPKYFVPEYTAKPANG